MLRNVNVSKRVLRSAPVQKLADDVRRSLLQIRLGTVGGLPDPVFKISECLPYSGKPWMIPTIRRKVKS